MKGAGKCFIYTTLMGAAIAILAVVITVMEYKDSYNFASYWGIWLSSYVAGMCEGWFLFDLLKMSLNFQRQWSWEHKTADERAAEDPKGQKDINRFVVTWMEYQKHIKVYSLFYFL